MMQSLSFHRFTAIALLLLAAPHARADQIQISWSYDFTPSTQTIQSNVNTDGKGYITVTPFQGTLTNALPSSATITAVNLQAFSSASAANPARFSDAEYTLVMHLTDVASGLSAAVTFEGILNGTISASGVSLQNQFIGQKDYSFDLDHHVYNISIGQFTAPGTPGSGELGSISVDVEMHHNPEPSSLLIAAFGLPVFGLFRLRKR